MYEVLSNVYNKDKHTTILPLVPDTTASLCNKHSSEAMTWAIRLLRYIRVMFVVASTPDYANIMLIVMSAFYSIAETMELVVKISSYYTVLVVTDS